MSLVRPKPLRRGSGAGGRNKRGAGLAYLALSPSLGISILYLVLPVVFVIWFSLTRWTGFDVPTFIGARNYGQLVSGRFLNSLWVTLTFAVLCSVASVAIGFTLSALIRQRIPGWRFYRVLWFAPTLVPGAAVAIVWASGAFYPGTGLADQIISGVGGDLPSQGWLATKPFAMIALVITATWAATGFPMLLISAAMERIPSELDEAARVDGAGRWRIATRITLPLVWPVVGTVLALQIIGLLKAFDLVYIMTRGGPDSSTTTIAYLMYNSAFVSGQSGLASTYAVALILLVVPLSLFARTWLGATDD